MKRNIYLSIMLPLLLLPIVVIQGVESKLGDEFSFIENGFRTGSARELASHFGMTVELKLQDREDVYGKSQVELLLDGFFRRHRPTSFEVSHQTVRSSTAFFVGNLLCGSESYRVNVFLKNTNSVWEITQIQIVSGGVR